MDFAFVIGLAKRWCPNAEVELGLYRGASGDSLRRELRKTLKELFEFKGCDYVVVLTDSNSDNPNFWKKVKRQELQKIDEKYHDRLVFGVPQRNIECWLCADEKQAAAWLSCSEPQVRQADPSDFVKSLLGLDLEEKLKDFLAQVILKPWIQGSRSFQDFWEQVRDLSQRNECSLPNEAD